MRVAITRGDYNLLRFQDAGLNPADYKMLPKQHRLKLKERGVRGWGDKKEFFTPLFKTTFRFVDRQALPKIAFVVYGKAGTAVKRNRVRRLLNEAVMQKIGSFPNGIEVVFSVNKLYDRQVYEQIDSLLDKFLSRIHQSQP